MPTTDEITRDTLNFDPLDAAERMVGGKGDDASGLGLLMHIEHNKNKQALLESQDDTVLQNGLDTYTRIIKSEGFEFMLDVPFNSIDAYGASNPENFYIYFHRADGILLCFDTFRMRYRTNERAVNSSHMYYNWKPNESIKDYYPFVSSGSFIRSEYDKGNRVWAGDHDGREALRFHLRQLRKNGKFVNPWIEPPHLWIMHHMDTKDKATGKDLPYHAWDSKKTASERFSQLPIDVQKMMGFPFKKE